MKILAFRPHQRNTLGPMTLSTRWWRRSARVFNRARIGLNGGRRKVGGHTQQNQNQTAPGCGEVALAVALGDALLLVEQLKEEVEGAWGTGEWGETMGLFAMALQEALSEALTH